MNGVRGFALNVSNFYTLDQCRTYGDAINAALSSGYGCTKSILVDTTRNGNGVNPGNWYKQKKSTSPHPEYVGRKIMVNQS
jgi:endoglucanase